MAEDFNDLIDQTETRAQALVIEADKAIELLDSVDAMVDNLSSTIEASAKVAKESFDTLNEQITTAEDTLQTQQEAAKESMNGLMQQMQEAGGKIKESLTSAFNKFGELQGKKQEFLREIGEELGNVSDRFGDLGEESDLILNNIQNQLEPINKIVDQFIEAVTEDLKSIDTQNNSLAEQLSTFIEAAGNADNLAYEQMENLFIEINNERQIAAQNINRIFEQTVIPEQKLFVKSIELLNGQVQILEQTILISGENTQKALSSLNDIFNKSTIKAEDIISYTQNAEKALKQIEDKLV